MTIVSENLPIIANCLPLKKSDLPLNTNHHCSFCVCCCFIFYFISHQINVVDYNFRLIAIFCVLFCFFLLLLTITSVCFFSIAYLLMVRFNSFDFTFISINALFEFHYLMFSFLNYYDFSI